MANVIGKFTDELEQDTSEVAEDVKDSVGQAIEYGVKSVVGSQLTSQQIQQQQLNDQKAQAEVRRKLQHHQTTKVSLDKVIQENKQKEAQRLQAQQQEDQQKQIKKLEERKVSLPKTGHIEESLEREDIARTRQESGKGHGVGG